MIDHAHIANLLRLASGQWFEIREDTTARINSTLGHYRRNVGKRPRAYSDRYDFRMKSIGRGTGRSTLFARHEPITFPLDE